MSKSKYLEEQGELMPEAASSSRKDDIAVLLVTGGHPGHRSMATNINKLLKILLAITCNVRSITPCNGQFISGIDKESIYPLRLKGRGVKHFVSRQFLTAREILSVRQPATLQIAMFAFGQDLQILPILVSKLRGKRVIIRSDGRPSTGRKKGPGDRSLVERLIFKVIEEINYRLADGVLTECEYMIPENGLSQYNAQVGSLFVDTSTFKARIRLHNRAYEIGFVGRLSEEKGILVFGEALAQFERNYDLRPNVIVIGDGEQRADFFERLRAVESALNVEHVEWMENVELPDYLNKIRIVTVPSYKEGLPNVVLESMSCGCVVLATAVGGVPEVIIDEETGFIMEDNSPECIAGNIVRALNHPNLEQIARNARALVEREFTFEKAVERYRKILSSEQ